MINFKNNIKVNWQKVQPAVKTLKCPVMANISCFVLVVFELTSMLIYRPFCSMAFQPSSISLWFSFYDIFYLPFNKMVSEATGNFSTLPKSSLIPFATRVNHDPPRYQDEQPHSCQQYGEKSSFPSKTFGQTEEKPVLFQFMLLYSSYLSQPNPTFRISLVI